MFIVNENEREYRFGESGPKSPTKGPNTANKEVYDERYATWRTALSRAAGAVRPGRDPQHVDRPRTLIYQRRINICS